MAIAYKRVLIKISGEALAAEKKTGFDFSFVTAVCEQVKRCAALGAEVGIVVGGGNFWRGVKDGAVLLSLPVFFVALGPSSLNSSGRGLPQEVRPGLAACPRCPESPGPSCCTVHESCPTLGDRVGCGTPAFSVPCS